MGAQCTMSCGYTLVEGAFTVFQHRWQERTGHEALGKKRMHSFTDPFLHLIKTVNTQITFNFTHNNTSN